MTALDLKKNRTSQGPGVFGLKLQHCIDSNGGEPGISSQGMSRRSLARDCSAA